VVLSVKAREWAGFERAVGQLAPLYRASPAGESAAARDMRQHVVGLHLMHLLVEARLADFHCRVEALSEEDRASRYVALPLQLEGFLMEGGYNKVLAAAASGPSELYAPFLGKLEHTVRDDVADCAAAAYPSLAVPAALKMLKLAGGAPALEAYSQQQGRGWVVEGGTLRFAPAEKAKPVIDAAALMKNVLGYAGEAGEGG